MKFGKLKEYDWGIFLFKNHVKIRAGRLVTGIFLFLKKALYKVKARGQHLSFNIFVRPRSGHRLKTNCIKL